MSVMFEVVYAVVAPIAKVVHICGCITEPGKWQFSTSLQHM